MSKRSLQLARQRRWYRKWMTWRRLSAGLFLSLLILGSFEWFPWFKGTTSGTKAFDLVPFTDPLAALELLIASHSITWTAAVGVGVLLLVAALMGPVFCGFICPLGLVLDVNQTLRRVFRKRVLHKTKRRAVPSTIPASSRYVLLGLLLGFALITGVPLFQALSPINLLVRALVMGSLVGLGVVVGLMALEWYLPRVWCRSLCPLGACYSIVGRKAPWRIRINPKTAGQIRCKQCQIRCPMGIEIMNAYTLPGRESVTHPSCIRCGDCIDVCPNTVLGLRARSFPMNPEPANDSNVHLPVLDDDASGCDSCEHASA